MKREIICVALVIVLGVSLTQTAYASAEMDALLKLLVEKGVVTEQEAEQLQTEVQQEIEEKPQPVKVMSANPVRGVKLGGKLEIRYQDSQGEENTFKMSNFEPYVVVDVDDHFSMKGQLECTPDNAKVNEAYAKYEDLPVVGGYVRAGKFRRKSFGLYQSGGARVSVDYVLLGRAFSGERQTGIEYFRSFKNVGLLGPVSFATGVFNGGDIGNRETGDNAQIPVRFVADRAGDVDDNQNKELTFRATTEPVKGLTIGGSALVGELSTADISTLNGYLSTSYTDDEKQRYGGDLTYKFTDIPLELRGEYVYGKTSDLDVDCWYVMGILKLLNSKLDTYARYSQLEPDIAATSSSYTWDLQQSTLGLIWYFNKTTQFQVEYEINGEDTPSGVSGVDNDMLRAEWQTKF